MLVTCLKIIAARCGKSIKPLPDSRTGLQGNKIPKTAAANNLLQGETHLAATDGVHSVHSRQQQAHQAPWQSFLSAWMDAYSRQAREVPRRPAGQQAYSKPRKNSGNTQQSQARLAARSQHLAPTSPHATVSFRELF